MMTRVAIIASLIIGRQEHETQKMLLNDDTVYQRLLRRLSAARNTAEHTHGDI